MEMAVVQLGGHPVTIRGEEVGLDVRETVEDVDPHPGLLPRRHRRPGSSTTRMLERMAARRPVPVVNLLSDDGPPDARRWPTCSPLRQHFGALDGPHGGLGRRRQQRGPHRWPSAAAHARAWTSRVACPPGYGPDPADRRPARRAGGDRGARHDRPGRGGGRAPTSSTPTSGPRWARRPRPTMRRRAFAGFTGRRRAHGAAPRRTPSSCTACRPTAARR